MEERRGRSNVVARGKPQYLPEAVAKQQKQQRGQTWGFEFCPACRINHNQGRRKHGYTKRHQTKVAYVLGKAGAKVRHRREHHLARPVPTPEPPPAGFLLHKDTSRDKNYWCWFCETEVINADNDFYSYNTFRHLASKAHRRAVEDFWEKTNAPRKEKALHLLSSQEWNRYKAEAESLLKRAQEQKQETEKSKQAAIEHCIHPNPSLEHSFPLSQSSSIVSPSLAQTSSMNTLRSVATSSASSPAGPSSSVSAASNATRKITAETIRGPSGVLQNPTGWHNGRRVWGGGIVKYDNNDSSRSGWMAWPVDLIQDEGLARFSKSAAAEETGLERKQTAFAVAESLTAITVPPLAPGEGNVHTGGTPPWLMPSSSTTSTTTITSIVDQNEEKDVLKEALEEARAKLKRQREEAKKNPDRVGADYLRQKKRMKAAQDNSNKDWMPSFGGVWTEGPRRTHRQAYDFNRDSSPSASASSASSKGA